MVLHGPLGDQTPQGPQPPLFNRAHMDRYVKQLSALEFTRLRHVLLRPAGPGRDVRLVPAFERHLQDNGFEKITGIFSAYPYGDEVHGAARGRDARPDRGRLRTTPCRWPRG